MRVSVIGTGHIGLVTAATIASLGHDVSAVDSDVEKIDMLRRCNLPFFEPGPPELVDEQVSAGRLTFEHDSAAVLPGAEVVVICVGTPANPDGETNLAAVERAALDIAKDADGGTVVVGKSTVPAGTAERLGYPFPILAEVARINDEAVLRVVEHLRDEIGELSGARIAILGLSFKPETDDIRLSPALTLAGRLFELGAEVVGFDPRAGANAKAEVPQLRVAADPYDAADGARAVLLATDWAEFRELDPSRLREAVASPLFVDARNAMDGPALVAAGFAYVPVGRSPLRPVA